MRSMTKQQHTQHHQASTVRITGSGMCMPLCTGITLPQRVSPQHVCLDQHEASFTCAFHRCVQESHAAHISRVHRLDCALTWPLLGDGWMITSIKLSFIDCR